MDVSIIIVNYNTKNLLKQCINSVFEKTRGIEFEIIVVDNASTDGSQQMIRNDFPEILLVESQENLGFGRANNFGFGYAKGRNIFLLNSDTILLNNAVKILSDYLDNNQKVGICGGNLYDERKCPASSFSRHLPSLFWELNIFFGGVLSKVRYGKNVYFNYTNTPLEVGYITGADMMLRASILRDIGGFDPDFFLYFEETELTYRVKKLNFSVYSVPDAQIIHLESRSFSDNYKKLKWLLDSSNLYYKKTHNGFERNIICMIFFLTTCSRIFCYKLSGNKIKLSYWIFVFQSFSLSGVNNTHS
jgi:GT2 family glycosyltransferase